MFNDIMNVQQGALASAAIDQSQAEELAKTLQAGHGYLGAPGSMVGGGALQTESIDSVLRSATFEAKNLQFWPSLPNDKCYNLVEQYVRTNSYGDGGSAYIPEAGSPAMNDSEYNRHSQKVVFLATRRGVSLPSTLVRQNFGGDMEGKEAQAGTLWILERLERSLYKSLSDFSNNGVFDGSISAIPGKIANLELMGFEAQIRAGDQDFSAQSRAFDGYAGDRSVIRSLDGAVVDESVIEDQAELIMENFGMPSELHLAPKQLSDFIKQFYPKERVTGMGMGMQDARAGYIVKTMATSAGDIALKANVFMRPKAGAKSQNDRAGVPMAPASAAAANVTDGTSKLKAGDKYAYAVAACNEQGEAAATATAAAATVVADGDVVKVMIASPISGNPVTHYAVYRTAKSGTGAMGFVGYVKATGSSTAFYDRGNKQPAGATGYLLDMRPETIVWKQLSPLLKLNLAQVSLAKEFILWLSGTLLVFAPRKFSVIENIGVAS